MDQPSFTCWWVSSPSLASWATFLAFNSGYFGAGVATAWGTIFVLTVSLDWLIPLETTLAFPRSLASGTQQPDMFSRGSSSLHTESSALRQDHLPCPLRTAPLPLF